METKRDPQQLLDKALSLAEEIATTLEELIKQHDKSTPVS